LPDLTPISAPAYLAARGYQALSVTELGGGVSNTVLLVETADGRFVLKQSLARLRVAEEWLSDRDRVFRECRVLRELAPQLPPGSVPAILFDDPENFLYAMEAAPSSARPWKDLLLEGVIEPETATAAGRLLAAIIRAGLEQPQWAASFEGDTVFDQLRLDPYYRFTASRHPDLAPHFKRLIEETTSRRVTLVHGDWSPKNLLVDGRKLMAIDFEVIHYGDPAFDVGFLLNHLLLKSFHRRQWSGAYRQAAASFLAELDGLPDWLIPAALRHLGCLLLARMDGKSPAEYIRDDSRKAEIRTFAGALILNPPAGEKELLDRWPS